MEADPTGFIELWGEAAIENWYQDVSEEGASSHPLEVVPPVVVVGAVELSSRESSFEPPEHPLVSDVHAERHLGLPAVAPEVALPHQDPDEDPLFECGRHEGLLMFHRKVPRET